MATMCADSVDQSTGQRCEAQARGARVQHDELHEAAGASAQGAALVASEHPAEARQDRGCGGPACPEDLLPNGPGRRGTGLGLEDPPANTGAGTRAMLRQLGRQSGESFAQGRFVPRDPDWPQKQRPEAHRAVQPTSSSRGGHSQQKKLAKKGAMDHNEIDWESKWGIPDKNGQTAVPEHCSRQ